MGQHQTTPSNASTSSSRARVCLRKGCNRSFTARRWNQRYCGDVHCLQEVRRWQAAKRQRRHRESECNRQRHAAAEAERRRKASERRKAEDNVQDARERQEPWSRSKRNFSDFCDRPGCYDPRPASTRAPSRYCSQGCRQAVRRVLDRERKWLRRHNSRQGSGRQAEQLQSCVMPNLDDVLAPASVSVVGDYRGSGNSPLSSFTIPDSDPGGDFGHDDQKEDFGGGPRPPPTG